MRFLILIHPDAIFEKTHDRSKIIDYLNRLNFAISRVSQAYTLFMYSDSYMPDNNQELYKRFRQFLMQNTRATFDKMTLGRDLFTNDLADAIIEHPDATIMYGGGYKDLCVIDAMKNFDTILGDIHHGNVVPINAIMFGRH